MPFSHVAGISQDGVSLPIDEISECLSVAVFNEVKRRALLELKDNDAQLMIDYLNMLSSHHDFVKLAAPKLRKHTVIVLQKLCEKTMLYPTCYALNGIEEILPKDAGGFCDIYQGRYRGQSLCLKVVRLYQKRDQHEMLKAHAREAILWSQLEHPNITPFYGIFYLKEAHGRICLLSPWMENGNIVDYLKEEPQVPRRPFLHDIASGLQYLHNGNIVHGDLKGANVLIDQFSKARLTDFGLSKILTDGTLGFTNTTKLDSGRTTSWASPELLEDNARPTPESDIWAFGCVCYEVLTGLSPFQGCTEYQVVRKLIGGYLPAQSSDARLDPSDDINQKIWQLMEQCWSSKPAQRLKCREILQKMENDAIIWQLRSEGSNNDAEGRPRFQYSNSNTGNPPLDHDRLRHLLKDLMGDLQEARIYTKVKDSLIVVGSHSSDLTGWDQEFFRQNQFSPFLPLELQHSRQPSSQLGLGFSQLPANSLQFSDPRSPPRPPPLSWRDPQDKSHQAHDATIDGGIFIDDTVSSSKEMIRRTTFAQLPSTRFFSRKKNIPPISPSGICTLTPGSYSSIMARNLAILEEMFPQGCSPFLNLGLESTEMLVLVVDSDSSARTVVKRMLTRLGCEVCCAEDGEVALEMILGKQICTSLMTPSRAYSLTRKMKQMVKRQVSTSPSASESMPNGSFHERQFTAIFLNDQMEKMSGLQVVAKLRALKRKDFVVGMTDCPSPEFLDAGADKILTKPVFASNLLSVLRCPYMKREKSI